MVSIVPRSGWGARAPRSRSTTSWSQRRGVTVHYSAGPPGATCSMEDCAHAVAARGWCDKHYRRWKRTGDPAKVRRVIGDDEARFFSHVDRRNSDECWQWMGSTNAPRYGTPYGTFRYQDRTRPAHVVSYLLANGAGSIPEGHVVDHLCSTTLCVNPAHLEAVTQRENVQRGRRTKVPAARIPELMARNQTGEPLAALAREVGISPQALRGRFAKGAPHGGH